MSERSTTTGGKAISNPALGPLGFLIGEWHTIGTHPEVPDETLCGRTSFSWLEGGAFLIMRSQIDHPQFPSGLAIIGSDDAAGRCAMTYFDERGTSRLFDVSLSARTVTWRRDNPEFSQSVRITVADGGDTLVSKGRMSKNGGEWVDDLSQVYTRAGLPPRR